VRQTNQLGSLLLRLRANIVKASFTHDLQSRTRDIESGYIWCAIHEFVGGFAIPGAADLDSERVFVGHAALKSFPQALVPVRTHIEVSGPWSTAKPFEDSTADEIYIQSLDVDRNRTERLERVEQHISADLVGTIDDRPSILDVSAAKDYV